MRASSSRAATRSSAVCVTSAGENREAMPATTEVLRISSPLVSGGIPPRHQSPCVSVTCESPSIIIRSESFPLFLYPASYGSAPSTVLRETDPSVYLLCPRSGGKPRLSSTEAVPQLPWDSIQVGGHLRCSVQPTQRRGRHRPLLEGLPGHLQPRGDIRQADEVGPHLPEPGPIRKGRHDLFHRSPDHSLRILASTRETQSDKTGRPETDGCVVTPSLVEGIENGLVVRLSRQRAHQVELELRLQSRSLSSFITQPSAFLSNSRA